MLRRPHCDRLTRRAGPIIALVVMLIGTSAIASASEPASDLISTSALQGRIDLVQSNSSITEAQKARTVELLQLAISRSESAAEQRQQAREYAEALADAPAEKKRLEAQKVRRERTSVEDLSDAPLVELEAAVDREAADIAAMRDRSAQLDSDIKAEKNFDVQTALAEARRQAPETTAEIPDFEEGRGAAAVLDAVTHDLRQANIDLLQQRLLSRTARLTLWETESALLLEQINAAEGRVARLGEMIADNRQSEASRLAAHARKTVESLADEPKIIRRMGDELVLRTDELQKLVASHDAVVVKKARATKETRRLEQKYSSLTEQLNIAQLIPSPEFGTALRKLHDQLTGVGGARRTLRESEQALGTSRIAQFQIDALRDPDIQTELAEIVEQLQMEPGIDVTTEREATIRALLAERETVLEKLSAAYTSYIHDLAGLAAQSEAVIARSTQYAELLEQQLLWMPSAHPASLETLSALGTPIAWLLDPLSWQGVFESMLDNLDRYRLVAALIAVLLLILLSRRGYFVGLMAAMKSRVGKVGRDNMSLSPAAIVLTATLSLPGPLIMAGTAALIHASGGFAKGLSNALLYGAIVYLILAFIRRSARENGLLELHFKWNPKISRALNENLPWFIPVIIPTLVTSSFVESQGGAAARDSLGRVIFIVVCLSVAMLLFRVIKSISGGLRLGPTSPTTSWSVRYISFFLVGSLPLLLGALSLFGYHHTAVQLGTWLWNSALVILAGVLLFCLAKREFAISERRLAFAKIRAARAAAAEQRASQESAPVSEEGDATDLELRQVDLQTISEQTVTVLKIAVTVAVGLALWNVWSGILPAFKPLENIELWSAFELVDGVASTSTVTLWNLILAMITAVVTFLAAKNIPGLLEVALLRRLSLQTGTSYALTTLSRYILVIAGTVIVLQLLGAQWSKLQWLVAALSVGLGFGLQEIVANFVSGIIILFERPIRIGDTVTVGDQWGTVSRIRIRATTIIDWDRREIIIPNKLFITERLVNWTLTDAITRTSVSVGVAYGSDIDLVERLLLEVAGENSKVLDEPPAEALFLNFGESSLDFTLRVFVKGYREHASVRHELHVAIDHAFRANGVVIAFPQRDLHFDPKAIEVHRSGEGQSTSST